MANATADTPDVSETKLARMRKDELSVYARGIGLKNVDDLKKPELLAQVKDKVYADAHGGRHRDGSGTSRNGDAAGGKGARRTAANDGKGTKGVGGGNSTADTPDVSETKLVRMKKDELREYARGIGLKNVDDLKKPELLAQVKDKVYADAHGGRRRGGAGTSKNGQAIGGKDASGAAAAKDGNGTKGRRGGNSTADTPDVSETVLARMRKDELREYAGGIGLKSVDDLKKPDLLAQVKDKVYADAHSGRHRPRYAPPGAAGVRA